MGFGGQLLALRSSSPALCTTSSPDVTGARENIAEYWGSPLPTRFRTPAVRHPISRFDLSLERAPPPAGMGAPVGLPILRGGRWRIRPTAGESLADFHEDAPAEPGPAVEKGASRTAPGLHFWSPVGVKPGDSRFRDRRRPAFDKTGAIRFAARRARSRWLREVGGTWDCPGGRRSRRIPNPRCFKPDRFSLDFDLTTDGRRPVSCPSLVNALQYPGVGMDLACTPTAGEKKGRFSALASCPVVKDRRSAS